MVSPGGLLDEVRRLAATSVGEALAAAQAGLVEGPDEDPDLLYLVAELHARAGNPHQAIDLIDRAQQRFDDIGRPLDAERCEIGRAAVLDDLGRLDEAIEAATRQLTRLRQRNRDRDVVDLETRALVNRGTCRESLGDYGAALDDYDLALSGANLLGDDAMAALIELNRSTVLDLLGRTAEALRGLRWAFGVLEHTGDQDDVAKVCVNIAAILCRRGEYDEGLAWFHRAEGQIETGTVNEAGIAVEVAEALASLGAIDEAVGRYRDALDVLARMPLSWLEGRAWLGLGMCSVRLGDGVAARASLRSALDAFAGADNLPAQVATLLELASIEGDDPATREFALDQARRALALADPARWPVQACAAHIKLADLSIGAEAERSLRAAARLARSVQLEPLVMRVEQRLGAHLLRHDRPAEAARHVAEAVRLADGLRRRLRNGTLLRTFPTETASCYDDMVEICLRRGDIAAACEAADRARSRSLSDLGLAVLGSAASSPAAREVEGELHAVYDRLLGIERLETELRIQLETRARDLEAQLDRLEFEIRPVVDAEAVSGEVFDGDESVPTIALTYLVADGHIDLLAEELGRPPRWFRSIATMSEVIDVLEGFHADGRRAHALRSAGVRIPDELAQATQRRLRWLGDHLLAALVDDLDDVATDRPIRLAISPIGPLHQVPFAALEVGTLALLDVAEVTVCPSHSVRRLCAGRPRRRGNTLLVGLTEGGIRSVAVEVEHLHDELPTAVALTEQEATLDAVGRATTAAATVHLASHGLFRSHAPLRSGVRLADGWLTARRAAHLDLTGAVVVLSACDTGRAVIADGEEVLGLQYGFIAAGARNVVLSLWPANDELTVGLMVDFHRSMSAGHTPAAALRSAQLAARAEGLHPWVWAPFVCSGATS